MKRLRLQLVPEIESGAGFSDVKDGFHCFSPDLLFLLRFVQNHNEPTLKKIKGTRLLSEVSETKQDGQTPNKLQVQRPASQTLPVKT